MPTKTTISLKPEDTSIVKDLRTLIENEDKRLSYAEVVRKSLQFTLRHSSQFQLDNKF